MDSAACSLGLGLCGRGLPVWAWLPARRKLRPGFVSQINVSECWTVGLVVLRRVAMVTAGGAEVVRPGSFRFRVGARAVRGKR